MPRNFMLPVNHHRVAALDLSFMYTIVLVEVLLKIGGATIIRWSYMRPAI
jgi:hypothetical protein